MGCCCQKTAPSLYEEEFRKYDSDGNQWLSVTEIENRMKETNKTLKAHANFDDASLDRRLNRDIEQKMKFMFFEVF